MAISSDGDVFFCYGKSESYISKPGKEPVVNMTVVWNKTKEEERLSLPLRCFYDQENHKQKEVGDKIKLIWQEKRVVLTCINRNSENYGGFSKNMQTEIDIGIGLGKFTSEHVQAAINSASEWIRLS